MRVGLDNLFCWIRIPNCFFYALDPNQYRQLTLWLHNLCLEVLTMQDSELCLFLGPRHTPYSYNWCCISDKKAVSTTFNVYNYDAVWYIYISNITGGYNHYEKYWAHLTTEVCIVWKPHTLPSNIIS